MPSASSPTQFSIAGVAFRLPDDAPLRVFVSVISGRLQLQLKVYPPDEAAVEQLQQLEVLPDWYEPEELLEEGVELSVDFVDVLHDPRHPTGKFSFEDGRCASIVSSMHIDKLSTGLRFNGTVQLGRQHQDHETNVAVNVAIFAGRLIDTYSGGEGCSLEANVRFEANELQLESYRYASFEETMQTPAERVHHLDLAHYNAPTLPARLGELSELRSLVINHRQTRGPLRALPESIARLTKLSKLTVINQALQVLPKGLGALTELESLTLHSPELDEVPEGVWTLPKLRTLSLSNCGLRSLPAVLQLPEVRSLSLSYNQLTELPEDIAKRCPQLERLDLTRNAFRSLPADVHAVPALKIEPDVLARLAPKPPQSGGPYDEAAYRVLDGTPRARRLATMLDGAKLQEDAKRFYRRSALPTVRLEQLPDATPRLGGSRFGGLPDMPPGRPYPRFGEDRHAYEFIAQLDCSELAPLQDYLPRTGMLYFFLSTLHDLYGDPLAYPVGLIEYLDVDRDQLTAGKQHYAELSSEDYYEPPEQRKAKPGEGLPVYAPFAVRAERDLSLAPVYALSDNVLYLQDALRAAGWLTLENQLSEDSEASIEQAEAFEASTHKAARAATHQIGAYGFSQHELPAMQAAQQLGGKPSDYVLLLEVRSLGHMQWGDAGELHFLVHKGALARGDFSAVAVGMYSS